MLNSISRNTPFCSFASSLIVSLTSFINKPDTSRYLTIFIISLIINVVTPDSNNFLWIAVFAGVAALNPNEVKILLANGLSIKSNPVFSDGAKNQPNIFLDVLFYAIEFLIILY